MEEPWWSKYKKIGREKWGKDFVLWKGMFRAFVSQAKDREYLPMSEMLLDTFVDVGRARQEGRPLRVYQTGVLI